jgi:tryptophan-rich sensory protein
MNTPFRKHPGLGFVVLLFVCFAVAGAGAGVTTPSIAGWYASLSKPTWTPPNWLFGPVWTLLYLSMAVAAWLVWLRTDRKNVVVPLGLFGIQLFLNGLWSWLFFGYHHPGAAFIDVVALWVTIAVVALVFWRFSVPAGLLFLPYLAWVSYAAALNFAIWRLNA